MSLLGNLIKKIVKPKETGYDPDPYEPEPYQPDPYPVKKIDLKKVLKKFKKHKEDEKKKDFKKDFHKVLNDNDQIDLKWADIKNVDNFMAGAVGGDGNVAQAANTGTGIANALVDSLNGDGAQMFNAVQINEINDQYNSVKNPYVGNSGTFKVWADGYADAGHSTDGYASSGALGVGIGAGAGIGVGVGGKGKGGDGGDGGHAQNALFNLIPILGIAGDGGAGGAGTGGHGVGVGVGVGLGLGAAKAGGNDVAAWARGNNDAHNETHVNVSDMFNMNLALGANLQFNNIQIGDNNTDNLDGNA